jgi:hypothetical protein
MQHSDNVSWSVFKTSLPSGAPNMVSILAGKYKTKVELAISDILSILFTLMCESGEYCSQNYLSNA